MTKFIAKPIAVEAFQYGVEDQPLWFLKAIRTKQVLVRPSKGHIVAKTESGNINFYDPKTFNALFETVEESKDLNNDGKVDSREKAIASETTKKKATKPRKQTKKTEASPTPKPTEPTELNPEISVD